MSTRGTLAGRVAIGLRRRAGAGYHWSVSARSLFRLAVPFALAACGVREQATPRGREVPFACDADEDCPGGSCLAEVGICTRGDGRLTKLLFEVTPQASDPIYGGARFLTFGDISAAPEMSPNVRKRAPP